MNITYFENAITYYGIEDMGSFKEFNKYIHDHTNVVVDLYTSTCVPCRKCLPKYEEFAKKYENVRFIKMNIKHDKDEFFDVHSVPAFAILKGGELVGEIIYGWCEKEIIKNIHKHLGERMKSEKKDERNADEEKDDEYNPY